MTRLETLEKAKIPCEETGIEIKQSICAICDPNTQCGLDVYVKDGRVVKVEGTKDHPYNAGTLCAKGAAIRQYVYSPDRVKTPLRRVGPRGSGQFEPISWAEAMDAIVGKCQKTKELYGPESVVFFAGYTKFFRAFLQRLSMTFGSPNYCNESSTCYNATYIAQKLNFGQSIFPDLPNTDCLVVWSANPFYTNHGNGRAIIRGQKRGMKLIVVDPRQTPTTARADIHLPLRPGTDGALALSMAHVMLEEGLYDKEFIKNWAEGFEEYKAYVKEFTPKRGEELTGVPHEKIIAAARIMAGSRSAAILPSASPVVHHTGGVQNYRAVFLLLALTGNLDVKGGALFKPVTYLHTAGGFESNERNFTLSTLAENMPPRIGAAELPVWMDTIEGEAQAVYLPEQLRTGKPYPLKTLLGFGMNHRMWPDSEGFLQSLESLDFFVNIDPFMTDTCKYADIVLPACTSIERSEFRSYGMNYAIFTTPAIEPVGESRNDIDIIIDLGRRLCPEDEWFAAGHEACIDYIIRPSGMTVAELKKHPGGMFIPNPLKHVEKKYKNGLHTPSGKTEFASELLARYAEREGIDPLPIYTPPRYSRERTPKMAEKYPLILSTGSRLPMFVHSRTFRLGWTRVLRPNNPAADLNPLDAKAAGIGQDDEMIIATLVGEIRVRANLTEMIQPGMVSIYHGIPAADANTLLEWDYIDPISGFPGYKSALCRIQKI